MAQRVVYLDDLDQSEGAETILFALEGKEYEIDLSEKNAERLRAALKEFIEAARPVDGRSVELYSRLPAGNTPALIHGAIRPGASVLELGAGAGRLVHPLIALGHPVTAVDHSPEMLACIKGATTVLSKIEDLALNQAFD